MLFRELKENLNGFELYFLPPVNPTIGLCCVLKSPEGDLCVIDGGNPEDADMLEEFLFEQSRKVPEVSAWLMTHGHGDHISAPAEILSRGKIRVRAVVCDIPDESYWDAVDPCESDRHSRKRLSDALENGNIPVIRPQKGEFLQFGSFRFRVLSSALSDAAKYEGNNTNLVYKWYTGKSDVLFLGDAGYHMGKDLLADFSDELPCPIVQMAHHGQNGVGKEVYDAIRPRVAVWPTPPWVWDPVDPGLKTMETRAWMDELKSQNILVKDGPIVIR